MGGSFSLIFGNGFCPRNGDEKSGKMATKNFLLTISPRQFLAILVIVLAIIILSLSFGTKFKDSRQLVSPQPAISNPPVSSLAFPIKDFKQRITKKPFGIHITKENSPVKPERFTGFHTGVDVEYEDVTVDVPVYAISDGEIVTSQFATGYGGAMVLKTEINSVALYIVYGHLRPSSMLKKNTNVTKGEQIAVLGTRFSRETDGERRHLHFGVSRYNSILGYTQSTESLTTGWIDPLSFY